MTALLTDGGFSRLLARQGPALEPRVLERAAVVEEVLAPAAWPDARVEAWIEGGAVRDPALPLHGAVHAHAGRIADAARRRGMLTRALDAETLRDELVAAVLLGLAATAPVAVRPRAAVADLATSRGRALLAEHVAREEAARLAAAAAPMLARRLGAVSEAVARCEGDPAACADPATNPALRRALASAREAGAGDDLLLDAISMGAAASPPPAVPPSPPAAAAPLIVYGGGEAGARLCADAAWRTGSVVWAPGAEAAALASRAGRAPRTALDVGAALELGGEALLAALAALWGAAAALDDAALLPAGVHEALAAEGLAYDSDPCRARAAALAGLVAREARAAEGPGSPALLLLADDAELALRLGGRSLGAAPWRGPVTPAEHADGPTAPTLAAEALAGLVRLGFDPGETRRALLGDRRLPQAGPLSPAALHGRGFTDHELSRAQAAMAAGAALRAAFAPEVVGEGFVLDVLGADALAVAGGGFDTLAAAGLSAAQIADAEAAAGGDGGAALGPEAQAVLADGDRLGPAPRLAMAAALARATGAVVLHRVELPADAPPAALASWQARAAELKLAGVRVARAADTRRLFLPAPPRRRPPPRPRPPPSRRPASPRRPGRPPRPAPSAIRRATGRGASFPTDARATSRRRRWAATRCTCTRASTTTASWVRSSSTCTRKARPSAR